MTMSNCYNIQTQNILFSPLTSRRVSWRSFIHIVIHIESLAATNIVAFKLDASFPLAGLLSRRDRYIEN